MRRWLKTKRASRVVVYTIEDQVLDGLLTASAGDGVVLMNVTVRSDSDVPLQGDIYIPREKVRFVQVLR